MRAYCSLYCKVNTAGYCPSCDTPPVETNQLQHIKGLGVQEVQQEPVKLPGFIRREVERAIDDAINPKGMSVHDGKAIIGADKLQYLLCVIDAAPQAQVQQEPDKAKQDRIMELADAYANAFFYPQFHQGGLELREARAALEAEVSKP